MPDEGRDHLKRAVFSPEQGLPYFAVEDALSDRADVADLPRGQVFRIEYGRDGVVQGLVPDRRRRPARPARSVQAARDRALGGPLRSVPAGSE